MMQNNPLPKKRHGYLTAWLICLIVTYSAVGLLYILNLAGLGNTADIPAWTLVFLIILSVVNVGCAILLFKWIKTGFYVFCFSSVLLALINLVLGIGVVIPVIGMLEIAVLFGALQIGGENKGWPQLE